ncbi:hypothetical protein KEF85_08230 [Methylomonas paludis]|uniref:Uncharacterized protein n=1 Tax=Methylomonas paludis TaxID=1173101 RepID=A0A975MR13_9GAMM|nr:hypothetical protein [Methylomonas paludis]QWF72417.1 hypothetical protein KEF85_08230 [Methylomonas paludis]
MNSSIPLRCIEATGGDDVGYGYTVGRVELGWPWFDWGCAVNSSIPLRCIEATDGGDIGYGRPLRGVVELC